MPSLIPIIAIVTTLAAVEGLAWWWMNPAAAGQAEPVLAYRPQVNAEMLNAAGAAATLEMAQPSLHAVSAGECKTEKRKEEAHAQSNSFSSNQQIGRRLVGRLDRHEVPCPARVRIREADPNQSSINNPQSSISASSPEFKREVQQS